MCPVHGNEIVNDGSNDPESYLIDAKVGIIHAVSENADEVGAPNYFHHSAVLCRTEFLNGRACVPVVAAAAANPMRSRQRTIRRAVAAYCASYYSDEQLTVGSSSSLRVPHVKPHEFARYSDQQCATDGFPWVEFDDTTVVRWTNARRLLGNERCLVPAAMTWVPYAPEPRLGEAPIIQPSIIGLACDVGMNRAICSGLYDVIKADALIRMWQNQTPPAQVRVETLSDNNYELVARFERSGDRVVLLDCTTEIGIPVILAAIWGEASASPYGLVCAGGCSLNSESAVTEALENLAHARWRYGDVASRYQPQLSNVTTARHHVLFWCDRLHQSHAQFLFSSKRRLEFDELPNHDLRNDDAELRAVVDSIGNKGFTGYAVDLTTDDIAVLGLVVVRALIPGYQPLLVGQDMQPLLGPRSQSSGRKPAKSEGLMWNSIPHPYAAYGFYSE